MSEELPPIENDISEDVLVWGPGCTDVVIVSLMQFDDEAPHWYHGVKHREQSYSLNEFTHWCPINLPEDADRYESEWYEQEFGDPNEPWGDDDE